MRRLLPLLLLLVGCSKAPSPEQQQLAVNHLARTFDRLKQLRVEDYRNQDWCQNLAYRWGKFSNNNEATTCNLFQGQATAFTPEAQRDFDAIAKTFDIPGTRLHYFSVRYSANGEIVGAEFSIQDCPCSYVYRPNYPTPPEDNPDVVKLNLIDRDWYFVERDWN